MTVEELAEASGVSLKEINDILGSRIKDVHRWTAEKLAEGAGLNVAIIGTEAYFHTMKNPGSK
jgi:predicted HTH domain antitoxin